MDQKENEVDEPIPGLKNFAQVYPEKGEFFLRALMYLNCIKAKNLTSPNREQLEVRYFSAKLADLCLTMEFPAITTVSIKRAFRLSRFTMIRFL